MSGVLPAACGAYSISRAIMTAPDYAYGTFRTLWTQSGGAIDGALRIAPLPADATRFYTHDSMSLAGDHPARQQVLEQCDGAARCC